MSVTKEQVQSALKTTLAMAEVVRELGEVPSGVLYAQLCGCMDFESYTACIRSLERANLVKTRNHVLIWIGPKLEGK